MLLSTIEYTSTGHTFEVYADTPEWTNVFGLRLKQLDETIEVTEINWCDLTLTDSVVFSSTVY